jgi:hypothetical protein
MGNFDRIGAFKTSAPLCVAMTKVVDPPPSRLIAVYAPRLTIILDNSNLATFAFLSTGYVLEGWLWGGLLLLVIGSIVFLISVLFKEIGEELTYGKKSGHSQRI